MVKRPIKEKGNTTQPKSTKIFPFILIYMFTKKTKEVQVQFWAISMYVKAGILIVNLNFLIVLQSVRCRQWATPTTLDPTPANATSLSSFRPTLPPPPTTFSSATTGSTFPWPGTQTSCPRPSMTGRSLKVNFFGLFHDRFDVQVLDSIKLWNYCLLLILKKVKSIIIENCIIEIKANI